MTAVCQCGRRYIRRKDGKIPRHSPIADWRETPWCSWSEAIAPGGAAMTGPSGSYTDEQHDAIVDLAQTLDIPEAAIGLFFDTVIRVRDEIVAVQQ